MIKKIDTKYIDKAIKNDKGDVTITYGQFQDVYENKIIKEPIPIIGKVFPFIKRKVKKNIKTDKKDLVINEITVSEIGRMGESAPKVLKDKLEEVRYRRIYQLSPEIYGEGLFLANIEDQKYEILGKEGVVIGQFDMSGRGYYSPSVKMPLLPKEANNPNGGACEPLSIEDIVSNYCAKNEDCMKFIPEQTFTKFPELEEHLERNIQNIKVSNKKEEITLA